MKKRVIAALLAVVMALGVVGCGKESGKDSAEDSNVKEESVEETEPEDSEEEEIIELTYCTWGTEEEQGVYLKIFEQFEKDYPNIKVKLLCIPTAEYITKITTMIAADESPDVGMMLEDYVLQWAEQGQFNNMLEYVEKDPDFSIDDVVDGTVYYWDDDKACGITPMVETYNLMYNVDVLEEAGITVPTTPETAWDWDEFVEVCQKLTIDSNGKNALDPDFDPENIVQYGIYPPSGSYMVGLACAYAGKDILNEEGTELDFVGTKVEEAVQKIADLMHVYHVAPTPVQTKNLPGGVAALASGKTAMVWDGQWNLLQLTNEGVNFGVGINPKMFGESKSILLGGSLVVFSGSKHPEEAYLLQKYLNDPKYAIENMTSGLAMPAYKEWYEDEEIVKSWTDNDAHPEGFEDAVMNVANSDDAVPVLSYTIKNWQKIYQILMPAVERAWTGEVSVAEAVSEVEAAINAEVQGRYVE